MPNVEEAEGFEWDEGNESELWAHRVAPEEAEQVWENGGAVARNKASGSCEYKIVGRTHGGRALSLYFNYDERRRIIRFGTGWDAPSSDQTRYL